LKRCDVVVVTLLRQVLFNYLFLGVGLLTINSFNLNNQLFFRNPNEHEIEKSPN